MPQGNEYIGSESTAAAEQGTFDQYVAVDQDYGNGSGGRDVCATAEKGVCRKEST